MLLLTVAPAPSAVSRDRTDCTTERETRAAVLAAIEGEWMAVCWETFGLGAAGDAAGAEAELLKKIGAQMMARERARSARRLRVRVWAELEEAGRSVTVVCIPRRTTLPAPRVIPFDSSLAAACSFWQCARKPAGPGWESASCAAEWSGIGPEMVHQVTLRVRSGPTSYQKASSSFAENQRRAGPPAAHVVCR